jgi:hypothetical protein
MEYAIDTKTNMCIQPESGNRNASYICPDCKDTVVFKKGAIYRPYFSHKKKCDHCVGKGESEAHKDAKDSLQNFLEEGNVLQVRRKCKTCKEIYYLVFKKPSSSHVHSEYRFKTETLNDKIADLACVREDGQLEAIFEICATHRTACEDRPEPWYEFTAKEVCDKFKNSCTIDKVTLKCTRKTFLDEFGNCGACDMTDTMAVESGTIFFNQRGAGCGKTYESIQLVVAEQFRHKKTFIFLTKMKSALVEIENQISKQYNEGKLGDVKLDKVECGNQSRFDLEQQLPEEEVRKIKIIIGTVDSFTYAVRNKDQFSASNDFFQKIVCDIISGMTSIASDGSIFYSRGRTYLSSETLVIIDEAQDLDENYAKALSVIIEKTKIDAYIIGDKLQSILAESNLFTYLENEKQSYKLQKSSGKNEVRRFHNKFFINFVNSIVPFEKFNLPPVESICSGESCGYIHEDETDPISYDHKFPHIYSKKGGEEEKHIDEIFEAIQRIKSDMIDKIQKEGYLPHNFMFIFPIVNDRNVFITQLYPWLQDFWKEHFSKAESYTDKAIENMDKSDMEFWKRKKDLRENDTNYYQYVFHHRNESGQPINLKESKNASRILSIHSSKGNGCECVYFLGINDRNFQTLSKNKEKCGLTYESLLHVGLTRQKKYIYIGYNRYEDDEVSNRFNKLQGLTLTQSYKIEPSVYIGFESIVKLLGTVLEDDKTDEKIFDFKKHKDIVFDEKRNEETIDWGHHIIRRSIMKIKIDMFMLGCSYHQKMAVSRLTSNEKCSFTYCHSYSLYSEKRKILQRSIGYNIELSKKKDKKSIPRPLEIPILVFNKDASDSKSSYSRYYRALKEIIDKVLQALRSNEDSWCPLQCVIYCHIWTMSEKPYELPINIMDVYRIISCFDTCLVSLSELRKNHCDKYKCVCENIFTESSLFRSEVKDTAIERSIVKHFELCTRLDEILKVFDHELKNIFDKGTKPKWTVYVRFETADKNFKIAVLVDYLGEDDASVVIVKSKPQFDLLNYVDTISEMVLVYFIARMKYKSKEQCFTIYYVILTLDSTEPIFFNLSELFDRSTDKIKSIVFETLVPIYSKELEPIFEYWSKSLGCDLKNLKVMCEDVKQKRAYIYDWFKEQLSKYEEYIEEDEESEIESLQSNLKSRDYVLKKLRSKLERELKHFLGITLGKKVKALSSLTTSSEL